MGDGSADDYCSIGNTGPCELRRTFAIFSASWAPLILTLRRSNLLRMLECPDCGVCKDGYSSSSSGQCVECSSRKGATIAMGVMLVIALLIVTSVAARELLGLQRLQQAQDQAVNPGGKLSILAGRVMSMLQRIPFSKLRIPIVVFQILTTFSQLPGVTFPSQYQSYLRWLSFINFDMSWLLGAGLGCYFNGSFYARLLLSTFVPLGVCMVLCGTWRIAVWRYGRLRFDDADRGHAWLATRWDKHIEFLILFLFLIYSTVSSVVLQTFSCVYIDEMQTAYLRADPSISCSDTRHLLFVVYSSVMVAVYPIGIAFLFFWLIWRDRHTFAATKMLTNRLHFRALRRSKLLWQVRGVCCE